MDGCMYAWKPGRMECMYVMHVVHVVHVCVCVDHLHRCKTSFCLVDGFGLCLLDFELCLQGDSAFRLTDTAQRRLLSVRNGDIRA